MVQQTEQIQPEKMMEQQTEHTMVHMKEQKEMAQVYIEGLFEVEVVGQLVAVAVAVVVVIVVVLMEKLMLCYNVLFR